MIADIADIISDLSQGKMCVLIDDEDRENEGDLVACASSITPAQINFMATYGRGLICLAMSESEIGRLQLTPMVAANQCPKGTAFTVSIDARKGISTGISAYDRAHTILLASNPSSTPCDFCSPGHVFPLESRKGGIFEREGHTEASVELSHLAGKGKCAVICEVMDNDGTMMRLPALKQFASRHGLRIGRIKELKRYLIRQKIQAAA